MLLTSSLKGYSFQLVFQLISLSRIHLTASLYLCPADCFEKVFSNKRKILTGTSWHFSDISSDISSLWAHESTSLDVKKANGTLYSNAKPIFCYNVTCFATNKSCSSRSHLSGYQCSSLLACKAAAAQLSTCFPISLSRAHLAASLYLCPADCFQEIMFEQAVNSHWKKLGFLGRIK